MPVSRLIARGLFSLTGLALVASALLTSGCVIAEPREGYYDRDHHRWYHEHGWHECGEREEHCRDHD